MDATHPTFPPEFGAIIDAVCDDDRAWFEKRPRATLRMRPYVPGESLTTGPVTPSHTLVTQMEVGVRTREFMYAPDHCPGREVLLYEADTGHVRGLFLDQDQELTLLRRHPRPATISKFRGPKSSRRAQNDGASVDDR